MEAQAWNLGFTKSTTAQPFNLGVASHPLVPVDLHVKIVHVLIGTVLMFRGLSKVIGKVYSINYHHGLGHRVVS